MRKRHLLVPPKNHKEILLLPEGFLSDSFGSQCLGTAHQPSFFSPGVSIKFILLDILKTREKKILFVDTDVVSLSLRIPLSGSLYESVDFVVTDKIFFDFPAPGRSEWEGFFAHVLGELKKISMDTYTLVKPQLDRYASCVFRHNESLLKDVLAKSFLDYYRIDLGYSFISSFAHDARFHEFFKRIYEEDRAFTAVFNAALDAYRDIFNFRYKNFPFPKLEEGELPFWIMRSGTRQRLFKKDISPGSVASSPVFPRAATLAIFLRMVDTDIFIHGTGGANYEWVCQYLMKHFFNIEPQGYITASGTFLLPGCSQRLLPFFFYSPEEVRGTLERYMEDR